MGIGEIEGGLPVLDTNWDSLRSKSSFIIITTSIVPSSAAEGLSARHVAFIMCWRFMVFLHLIYWVVLDIYQARCYLLPFSHHL